MSRPARRRAPGRTVRALLATSCAALTLASAAHATTPQFVWSGNAGELGWSHDSNWEGGAAPSSSQPIDLRFPRLPSCLGVCYESEDDLSGIQAESLEVDDGDEYFLGGEGDPLTLGSGGLIAAPAAGSSGPAGDFLELPISLSASQDWSFAGRNGGALGENGAIVFSELSGSGSSLNVQISNSAALYLVDKAEVGPAAVEGADATKAGVFNGLVDLLGDLNFENEHAVALRNIFALGDAAVGALRTEHAELEVGSGLKPAQGLIADSAEFDGASEIDFEITGPGGAAGSDYSQLVSFGTVQLGGSKLLVHVRPPSPESSICPTLTRGQTYTLVTTPAQLLGTFANAPEGGPEVLVEFAKACNQPARSMRIEYHRAGATETVTGKLEAAALEAQEANERREAQERQEGREREQIEKARREAQERQQAKEHQEAVERQEAELRKGAEAAAAKQREEEAVAAATIRKRQEEAAAAAANRSREEEQAKAAHGGVLAVKEAHKPPTRAQLLAKALKACKKQPRHTRKRCEAEARKRYGSRAKGKKGKRG
jgi:hypothetical protein